MDHPQPLLEKRRGDDSGSVDAFSRAILDEKDPAIRGYLENLRSQIAAIAAAHGANARDVWNREVQDRMSVDEMDRVNALFARIKALAEKRVSRDMAGGMERELAEREAVAREMLEDALGVSTMRMKATNEIARYFLRADLLQDMRAFVAGPRTIALAVEVEWNVAEARAAREAGLVDEAWKWAFTALDRATRVEDGAMKRAPDYEQQMRMYLQAYGEVLALQSDAEIGLISERKFEFVPPIVRPIAVERLAIEFARRGIERGALLAELRAQAERDLAIEFTDWERISYELELAELRHANGLDGRPAIAESIRLVKSIGCENGQSDERIIQIFETIGKIGAFELVEPLRAETWWHPDEGQDETNVDLDREIADGCVEAKDFDRALAYFRASRFKLRRGFALTANKLVVALFDADQIARGEEVRAEFFSNKPVDSFRSTREHIAARARRGDDVLSLAQRIVAEDRQDASKRNFATPTEMEAEVLTLANAAIATIGYTVAMRKRIAEYASKR